MYQKKIPIIYLCIIFECILLSKQSNKPSKYPKFPREFAPSNSKPFTIDILQPRLINQINLYCLQFGNLAWPNNKKSVIFYKKHFILTRFMSRHREDLVKYIDEIFLPLDPMGFALGHKELREKRDPVFLAHSREYAEFVSLT